MIKPSKDGKRFDLFSPTALPKAGSFLWNKSMMIHVNCRGFATSQFMQPEPAKYAHGPMMESKSFMQPEQSYYPHHPGRFFYIKDEVSGDLFSSPYEPVRKIPDSYLFSAGRSDISWNVEKNGVQVQTCLTLDPEEPIELWTAKLTNNSDDSKELSFYVFFPVGYMSWMNQGARFEPDLNAIVCSSVTPYQKLDDYFENQHLKDLTYLVSDETPDAWESSAEVFEGEGGLHNPAAIGLDTLQNGDADYEIPACVMQFRVALDPFEEKAWRFLFGPAKNKAEIEINRKRIFKGGGLEKARRSYTRFIDRGFGKLKIKTPEDSFDNFVNEWLPRQIFYHGTLNRLSTDPQTRNFLQDNMGMSYLDAFSSKNAFRIALSQQRSDGSMPDGIILSKDGELKYINQVPHTDHCVWLPISIRSWLDETADYAFLEERVGFADSEETVSVGEHIGRAMRWLLNMRDERGLVYISQGDWCDPMNMVGYKGKGVSGWLTLAAAYALKEWADICQMASHPEHADEFRSGADELNNAVNKHLWDGDWYARGITDDGIKFGIKTDTEGKIFLNPQSWAILSGASDGSRTASVIDSVSRYLDSPYGTQLLAPPFTKMREDIGRVTQKFPGSAENGSVYNHASAFYIYSLFKIGRNDEAFEGLLKMLPNEDDYTQRGQLPVYLPNYYRGAFEEYPRTAGRSSQLFNTGSVHWYYRSLIDGLFGLRGCPDGLSISPRFPNSWEQAKATRIFRGARFEVSFRRSNSGSEKIEVDGVPLDGEVIRKIEPGITYNVLVRF